MTGSAIDEDENHNQLPYWDYFKAGNMYYPCIAPITLIVHLSQDPMPEINPIACTSRPMLLICSINYSAAFGKQKDFRAKLILILDVSM